MQNNLWTNARNFTDETSGVAVVVKKQLLPKRYPTEIQRPIFSYEICRITEQGGFVRYFGALTETYNGKVSFRKVLDTAVVSRLVTEAEQWILDECQAHCDAVIEAKQQRERKEIDRDKPKQQMGLKKLAQRDKLNRSMKEA